MGTNGDVVHDITALSLTSGGLYAVRRISKENADGISSDISISLHKVSLGSTAGNITVSEPLAEISEDGVSYRSETQAWPWLDKLVRERQYWVYESSDKFIIGSVLVADKATMTFTPISEQMYMEILPLIPDTKNIYKGRVWDVGVSGAAWLDLETLDYGFIDYNNGIESYAYPCVKNIPAGKAAFMIPDTDGSFYLLIINDIESGESVKGNRIESPSDFIGI